MGCELFFEMAISKLEQQLLFQCSVELGAVQFIEAHHNPPALQLLGGPELALLC